MAQACLRQQSHRPEMQGVFTAANGTVMGYGRRDGREVLVGAEDFTVMGGPAGITGIFKYERRLEIGGRAKILVGWLLDRAGARE